MCNLSRVERVSLLHCSGITGLRLPPAVDLSPCQSQRHLQCPDQDTGVRLTVCVCVCVWSRYYPCCGDQKHICMVTLWRLVFLMGTKSKSPECK